MSVLSCCIYLDKLAKNWLPFSNGGDQRWRRQIAQSEMDSVLAESRVLDIRRERRKNGDLFIHLFYPDSEGTISCKVFRNTLKLPSGPDSINPMENRETWEVLGIGAGHGQGLAIVHAQALADAGRSAEQILRDGYGHKNNADFPLAVKSCSRKLVAYRTGLLHEAAIAWSAHIQYHCGRTINSWMNNRLRGALE